MSTSREKLLAQFRELVIERLGKVSRALMVLEAGPSMESGRETLRELHGLKGEARMMGFAEVNSLVHQMEELVRTVEPLEFALQPGSVDALLASGDAVSLLAGATQGEKPDPQKLIAWLGQCTNAEAERIAREGKGPAPVAASAPVPAPAASPTGAPTVPKPGVPSARASAPGGEAPRPTEKAPRVDGSIRITHKSLEVLTSTVAGLGHRTSRRVSSAHARAHLAWELRQLHRLAEDLGPQAQELAARLNKAKEEASELTRLNSVLDGEDAKDLQVLQGEVQNLRMVPLSVLFESYPRMVRELSKDLGKDVELTIRGENEQVDRSVLEVLSEPLLHLVRNAVDHGLEPPEERAAAEKAPRGRLVLLAQREGDRLALSVEDDGKGMSAGTLRAVAVKKGLFDQATADGLSDLAALDLVFLPGFSSKDLVSDVSGRGVGLDVVRQKLLGVGGEVTIETKLGAGSAFRLKVPISLALAPVLFVQVGDERVCLPASGVARAVHLEAGSLREVAGKAAVALGDEVLPLGRLAPLLGLGPETPPREGELALVLHGRGQTAAVLVDRVLEERVQAILPVRMLLSSLPHLSGATQMADGTLALVLSAAHLVGAVQGRERRLDAMLGASAERKKRLMVVDDSPLTRELLVSLLESAGYFILQAADGAEALERLATEPVDCVVTDLEMPRVDGLELTRRVKAHPTLRSLPVVIVTTRGSDVDRRRGMEAGADGYVAKGDLVRKDLADVLTRLLG